MRSPNEGPGGILSNDDFKDTVRLLDFARVGYSFDWHACNLLINRHW